MTSTRTVLVTGAAGVVGRALLPELAEHHVVCLAHRRTPQGADETVHGDLRQPLLGLAADTYRELARRVDTVVHCAAVTSFNAGSASTEELNVAGTRGVVDFAAAAGARLLYVSTAFVARTDVGRYVPPTAATNPEHYLASKRAAESVVRSAPVEAAVVRPSIVIGDAVTGEIAEFQGLHQVAQGVIRNLLPLVPIAPSTLIDFVASDVLARALARLVAAPAVRDEYWVTGGPAALDAATVFGMFAAAGRRAGRSVHEPRLVDPEMVERLIRPAFIDTLPAVTRRRFDELCGMSSFFAAGPAFPSSLPELGEGAFLTPAAQAAALDASMDHLVAAKRLGARRRAEVAA